MRSLAWALALALAAPSVALARDFRVNDIPNGSRFMCLNCHTDESGKTFTPFGSDAKSHLVPNGNGVSTEHVAWDMNWCLRDSDGDGFTNGQELGDPNCTWKAGDANPAGTVTNPGVAASAPGGACGNGQLDSGELCDGDETIAFSCSELSLGTGLLSCTTDCTYDTSACQFQSPPSLSTTGGGDDGGSSEGCAISGEEQGGGALAVLGVVAALAAGARRPRKTAGRAAR
jgi:MYXO-CTERM domain-containing protein